ncbi:MAG TPA: C1 family peptidase [Chitinophagaceae bacterium]|nr:C1 family peptidase [Chitinophagaceae bacterium]
MKKIILSLIALIIASSTITAQDNLVNSLKGNQSDSAKIKFQFTSIVNLENSPVKSQGSSGTCWSYSGNSFLESEMMRNGKEFVDISEIYTARCAYIERAKNYVRMHGNIGWGDGAELHDVVAIYKKYGAVPYEIYTGLNYGTTKNKFGEMQAALEGMLKGIVSNKNGRLTKNWLPAFIAALDSYLGKVPESFTYKGKEYTPLTFASEVVGLQPDQYIELSSFTYAPNYEPTLLMVPDNWSLQNVYNIPFENMTDIVDNALKNGYTVAWATDVSEKYFSWKNGVAIVPEKEFEDMDAEEQKKMFDGPQKEREINAEVRENAFDDYTTTDDHGMHIVGLAKDQYDKEYYMVKNSWGDKNDYKGYLYVSKTYFNYKTTAFLVNEAAIPGNILRKLK